MPPSRKAEPDPAAVVYAGRRLNPDTIFDHSGFLAERDFRKLHLVRCQTKLVVMASLFLCALSFAGAIFLVLELDNPFTGLMGISSATLLNALLPLNFALLLRHTPARGGFRCQTTRSAVRPAVKSSVVLFRSNPPATDLRYGADRPRFPLSRLPLSADQPAPDRDMRHLG